MGKLILELKARYWIKQRLLPVFCFIIANILPFATNAQRIDSLRPVPTSTPQQAAEFMDKISSLSQSIHWPNIKPKLFLDNLKNNVRDPLSPYPGRATNFCGYGALTYLMLQDDPLGYAKLILALYNDGKATYSGIDFAPSTEVKLAAGTFHFKGELDIHPAEQLWYLSLADRFKGYLNIFNRRYDEGDENTFWAAVNYAKFNRMVKRLLDYDVHARGSDLLRPMLGNTYDYISEHLKTGIVVLYINNRILHKKRLEHIKLAVPTHFVVLQSISRVDDLITMTYWDYGHKTQLQIDSHFLKKIVFGISHCTKRSKHE